MIEAAVVQRARLANAILRDIYGEQRLLRDGIVPPQLVLGHPQYLRALQGVTPPGGVHVHLYSIDLARAPRRFVDGARQPRRCADRAWATRSKTASSSAKRSRSSNT